jgi:hypothetical protein
MKRYQLSSAGERMLSITFSVVMIVVFVALVYVLRNNMMLLLICGGGGLLLGGLLAFYIVSVLKAACVWNPDSKKLEVQGFPSYTLDLSDAVMLQTVARKSSQSVSRALVFTNAQEEVVGMVPTLFTYKQGVLAEPLAKTMAQEMGLEFKENVPEWHYNKDKYQEHLKEEAAAQKAESKKRREDKMRWFINRRKGK